MQLKKTFVPLQCRTTKDGIKLTLKITIMQTQITAENLKKMTNLEIFQFIRKDWKNINYGAKPYLDYILQGCWGCDSEKSSIAYFLSNASQYKGETAKMIKQELKKRIK